MGRITKLLLIFIIFLISSFYFLSSGRVYAQTPCQPIYGGGQTCTSSKPSAGNFPVLNPPVVSKSPATGPEALVLFALMSIGILGWILRKKSKREPHL